MRENTFYSTRPGIQQTIFSRGNSQTSITPRWSNSQQLLLAGKMGFLFGDGTRPDTAEPFGGIGTLKVSPVSVNAISANTT